MYLYVKPVVILFRLTFEVRIHNPTKQDRVLSPMPLTFALVYAIGLE